MQREARPVAGRFEELEAGMGNPQGVFEDAEVRSFSFQKLGGGGGGGGGSREKRINHCGTDVFRIVFVQRASYFLEAGAAIDKAAEPSHGGTTGGAATVVLTVCVL